VQHHLKPRYDNLVSAIALERIRDTIHRDPALRSHDAARERALAEEQALTLDEDAGGVGGASSAKAGLEALFDMLDACGLARLFHAVHAELGLEAPTDLEDLTFDDLHSAASLPPLERTELAECVCEGRFRDLAVELCGGEEL